MACSCFCWKRNFARLDRTPLKEYDENKQKVVAIEGHVSKLVRSFDQFQNSWVRIGELMVLFAKELQQTTVGEGNAERREQADRIASLAQTVSEEMRNHHLGEGEHGSTRLLQYIKEFQSRLRECRERSARLEKLAKDYDARRAVVSDKEQAKTEEKKLAPLRDLMYEAESRFREAEADVLQRQKFIITHAPLITNACLICFAAIESERVQFLAEKSTDFYRLRDDQLRPTLHSIETEVFPPLS
ncbi:hypothetical protein CCYA_CCYA15G3974 [Cyanidiococcus yangmingshanensis]|nr:hypothetical protein CCYA_CCYA15G3974 [Cyanidiococcus yangmingshanensis]